ncbi:hypothetical protein C8J57DRAFT_1584146 [Mycena rebaudengoi]|nr:hypothetical protein C8J57DRAFT_1584146 [Mycena rebaudengoi]
MALASDKLLDIPLALRSGTIDFRARCWSLGWGPSQSVRICNPASATAALGHAAIETLTCYRSPIARPSSALWFCPCNTKSPLRERGLGRYPVGSADSTLTPHAAAKSPSARSSSAYDTCRTTGWIKCDRRFTISSSYIEASQGIRADPSSAIRVKSLLCCCGPASQTGSLDKVSSSAIINVSAAIPRSQRASTKERRIRTERLRKRARHGPSIHDLIPMRSIMMDPPSTAPRFSPNTYGSRRAHLTHLGHHRRIAQWMPVYPYTRLHGASCVWLFKTPWIFVVGRVASWSIVVVQRRGAVAVKWPWVRGNHAALLKSGTKVLEEELDVHATD